jgi:twitching motility protein PilT
MAALDKLLDAMVTYGAEALTLEAGAVPLFHFDGSTRPVAKQTISEAQVLSYLRELAPAPAAEVLEGLKPCTFVYRTFAVAVEFTAQGVRARVTSQDRLDREPAAKPQAVDTGAFLKPPKFVVPLDELFYEMIHRGASDLHISTGEPPLLRLDGAMLHLQGRAALSAQDVRDLLWPIAPERNREEFDRCHDTDFAYEIEGLARFRCNFFMDRFGMGGVFRQIPTHVPTVEELGLSRAVVDLCWLSKGLVLVTGPTGSGKSTTLAALINFVNENRTDHIITIEDPIEFVHPNKRCLINQREVAVHTEGFKRALRAALREDPDIVLVGEMRDLETVAIAIETAETGHLVFGTLHTTTAPSTVDRIIDQFPADRQAQIRMMLSESLKGVISQTLCKKIGGGRVAAFEVLLVNSSISNLIREGKVFQIPSIMQTQKGLGNMTLNDALFSLVKSGQVEPKEAYIKSVDKVSLKSLFERHKIDLAMETEKPA